ncbi:MAG: TonB-dependent receptor [Chitinophaga sp.]|uniref:TonB-dependent receptor n=1 Tax=Chitinophaga sp. TaxID=1869181 RepID=UPI001B06F1F0|nr:TonB-dependent receptor [Chitinophaga sp.]MBO9732804.1 TonB-dependent receptor [Chitinophaga sp.]
MELLTISCFQGRRSRMPATLKTWLLSFLLLAGAFSVSAQTPTVKLSVNKMPLDKVFDLLSKQTGYQFICDEKLLENTPPLSVDIKNKTLEDALKICLKDLPLTYVIKYNTVVIKKSSAGAKVIPGNGKDTPGKTITGTITDSTGMGLPGVSVGVKSTPKGVQTDVNGHFTIHNITDQDVLTISSIGYQTIQEPVKDQSTFHIRLSPTPKSLVEVVVVGYSTQKKVDLTGAVATVSGETLAARPVGQTSAGLQGTMPGVTITQGNGKPGGDGGSIRIRGWGTLKNPDPLILIDGVEGSINNIDPNVIASVTVLKDAASASIYGSRAANGVILVTTKRGKSSKLSINYNNYVGWQQATNLPDLTNALDYMLLANEAYKNSGRTPLYAASLLEKYRRQGNGSSDSLPNTDWQKAVLTGSGFQQSHFLTVNGGTDKVKMLLSVGYFDQKGLIKQSEFKRLTVRANNDIIFSKKLNMQFDLQYISPVTTEPSAGVDAIFAYMNNISPNQLAVNSNGTRGDGWVGNNPAASAKEGGLKKLSAPWGSINTTINYQPVEWLTASFNIAPKYIQTYTNRFSKALQTYHPDGTPANRNPQISALEVTSQREFYNNMRGTLTFHKAWGKHDVKVLAGAEQNNYRQDVISASRDNYVLPDYPVLDAGGAGNMKNSGGGAEWSLRSFFGRVNYNYKEKYLLEMNIRNDGSSRFAEGRKWGVFPSASAGWRISEEDFMAALKPALNELKLRGSWGKLGNQNIGTYPSATVVNLSSYTIGGQIVNAAAMDALANRNITWETTEMTDVGLDITLFSHLSITADYYSSKTKDILLLLNIPLITGLKAPYQNAGKVSNKGWELGLNYDGAIKDFKYNIGVNVSDVKNKVVDMHGINQSAVTVSREGYPVNAIFGLQAEGFFQDADEVSKHATQFGTIAPGDIRYKDQNGDGIINESDKVILGNTIPRYTYGISLNARWKGFDLGVFLQGVGKVDGLIYGAGIMPFYVSSVGGTAQERFKDYWTPEHKDAAFPRLVFGGTNNQQISSFWMKSAAYLRLKNLQIGYTLPRHLAQSMKLNSLRVFVNGSNLFTANKFWKGYDVETAVGVADNYPVMKMYSFGVNVNF